MTELPYEIWLLIVEYLPDHQVRRLYSVNRALFNIALDLRYKAVSLGILLDEVIEKSNPPILRYSTFNRTMGLLIYFQWKESTSCLKAYSPTNNISQFLLPLRPRCDISKI